MHEHVLFQSVFATYDRITKTVVVRLSRGPDGGCGSELDGGPDGTTFNANRVSIRLYDESMTSIPVEDYRPGAGTTRIRKSRDDRTFLIERDVKKFSRTFSVYFYPPGNWDKCFRGLYELPFQNFMNTVPEPQKLRDAVTLLELLGTPLEILRNLLGILRNLPLWNSRGPP